jgi:hypothetical protein
MAAVMATARERWLSNRGAQHRESERKGYFSCQVHGLSSVPEAASSMMTFRLAGPIGRNLQFW